MGQTLTHGIYLPSEGERNCYSGLAANWNAVDTLKGNYSLHAINVEIHVTTAEKTLWNTVSDKANNTDVVHKSGAETIPGQKTFEASPYIYNQDDTANTPSLNLRNSKVTKGTTTDSGSQIIQFLDKNLKYLSQIVGNKVSNGSSALKFNVSTFDGNSESISAEVQLFIAVNGTKMIIPTTDNDVGLGRAANKWKDINTYLINGINPGALFLPKDRSNRVDISAYFTSTASGDTNRMTAPDDGFIYLSLTDVLLVHCFSQTDNNLTHYAQTFGRSNIGLLHILFPVRKNDNCGCQWYTTATAVTVNSAFFIPCKGNI